MYMTCEICKVPFDSFESNMDIIKEPEGGYSVYIWCPTCFYEHKLEVVEK